LNNASPVCLDGFGDQSRAHVPVAGKTTWLETDHNHQPNQVRPLFDAFKNAGGKGELVIEPASGDNGHAIVNEPELFLKGVLRFFHVIGFT